MFSINDLSLDYDNITLVSNQISFINSRDNIDTSIYLFPNFRLNIPIIASPMVDVVNADIARKLRELGGFAFLHRFCSIEDQCIEFSKAGECGCAIGLDDWDRLANLLECGCKYFILDIANAANERVKKMMDRVSKQYPLAMFIIGNVVSGQQFKWCQDLSNVYGIRVGVAGGKSCTTKNATGIFYGAISLLRECKLLQNEAQILADGGIRGSSDLCKGLAAGANGVILGSLIAACKESPAPLVKDNGKWYKIYRGSSSYDIQKIYKDKPRYIEGKSSLLEYTGETIEDLISKLTCGLRSSMSYFNAKDLVEYYSNSEYKIIL